MKNKITLPVAVTGILLSAFTLAQAQDVSGRPTRVMPVGDSITEGQSGADYRKKLRSLVVNGNKTIDFVGHNVKNSPEDGEQSGEGGWRADELAGTAPPPSFENPNIGSVQTWIPTFKPDIILLMAGKNDILDGDGGAATTSNVEELIDECFAAKSNVRIIVGLVPPSRNNTQFPGTHVNVNNNIKSYVSTLSGQGKKIQWVDTYSIMNDGQSSLYGDSVHPNQTGYDKIATTFHNALKGYLNNTPYTKLSGTTIGSGNNNSSNPYSKAFDGNTSTGASLNSGGWVGKDFGSAKQIYNIRVRHGSSYDRKLRIQGSNSSNFSNLTTLKTIGKANSGKWEQRSILNTGTYRYVRVRPDDGSGISIREFEIFSVGGSGGSSSSSSSSGSYSQNIDTPQKDWNAPESTSTEVAPATGQSSSY